MTINNTRLNAPPVIRSTKVANGEKTHQPRVQHYSNSSHSIATHMYVPTGGLAGLYQQNKKIGTQLFQEWDPAKPDWKAAEEIRKFAQQNTELREMGFDKYK